MRSGVYVPLEVGAMGHLKTLSEETGKSISRIVDAFVSALIENLPPSTVEVSGGMWGSQTLSLDSERWQEYHRLIHHFRSTKSVLSWAILNPTYQRRARELLVERVTLNVKIKLSKSQADAVDALLMRERKTLDELATTWFVEWIEASR